MSDNEVGVSRIGIGRLHNLGNYEHIRYDVTLELGEGANVGKTIRRLEKLLGALAPITRDYDYQRALKIMSDPEAVKDESERNIEVYKKRIENHDKAVARRAAALEAFNNLGGAFEHVDAKLNWDDDDYYDGDW